VPFEAVPNGVTDPARESETLDLFEELYANLSLAEIEVAVATLQARVQVETDRLSADRWEKGLYEERIYEPGEGMTFSSIPGQSVTCMSTNTFINELGNPVAQWVTIPRGEYPDYDRLQDEYLFAFTKAHELKKRK
jgi:hypothetical protein